jgi:hypothetical protein
MRSATSRAASAPGIGLASDAAIGASISRAGLAAMNIVIASSHRPARWPACR